MKSNDIYSGHLVEGMMNQIKKDHEKDDKITISYEDIENSLCKYWEPRIAHIWQVDDVVSYAKEHMDPSYEISKDEALGILSYIQDHLDCNYGITWGTIHDHIQEFLEEKEAGLHT